MSSSYGAGVALTVDGNIRSASLQYLVANAVCGSLCFEAPVVPTHFPAGCAVHLVYVLVHWPSDLLLVPGLVVDLAPGLVVTWCLA